MVEQIDFSPRHDVLIRGEDGTLLPMDVPYYESEQIAPGTWKIRSDGDSQFLLEGTEQSIVIDSGYGAGNIRAYCQSLTKKPIHYIINTHDHFDHTANNAYFDAAYMTEETAALATIPFPSFAGIDFPRDYEKRIVRDGDILDLGDRPLEMLFIPDHAPGSIAVLDHRERILFAGDEIVPFFKKINSDVETVLEQFKRLRRRSGEYDVIWSAPVQSPVSLSVLDTYIAAMEAVMNGAEPKPGMGFSPQKGKEQDTRSTSGAVIYERFRARPEDMKVQEGAETLVHLRLGDASLIYRPDRIFKSK